MLSRKRIVNETELSIGFVYCTNVWFKWGKKKKKRNKKKQYDRNQLLTKQQVYFALENRQIHVKMLRCKHTRPQHEDNVPSAFIGKNAYHEK